MNPEEESVLVEELMHLFAAVEINLEDAHPSRAENLSAGQQLVLSIFSGVVSLFQSIKLLLESQKATEGRMIYRTLMHDAIQLMYFASSPGRLEEFWARYEFSSIQHERLLHNEAAKLVPQRAKRNLDLLDRDEAVLKKFARDHNFPLKTLPLLEQMFREMDISHGYYSFRFSSHPVHTSRVALAMRVRDQGEGRFLIDPRGTPDEILRVGVPTVEHTVLAHEATAHLLSWKSLPEIESFSEFVRAKLSAIGQRAELRPLSELPDD